MRKVVIKIFQGSVVTQTIKKMSRDFNIPG